MSDTTTTATTMAERLTEVAVRCDALGVPVASLSVMSDVVQVQVRTEAHVDILAAEYGLDPDNGVSRNYLRISAGGSLEVYGPRTARRCACGAACTHGGAA